MSESVLSESFVAALRALTGWLEAEHIAHTMIEGVAVSLLAQPRATQDIDAVIWLEESRWPTFLKAGEASACFVMIKARANTIICAFNGRFTER
jgi:hypothetical protein